MIFWKKIINEYEIILSCLYQYTWLNRKEIIKKKTFKIFEKIFKNQQQMVWSSVFCIRCLCCIKVLSETAIICNKHKSSIKDFKLPKINRVRGGLVWYTLIRSWKLHDTRPFWKDNLSRPTKTKTHLESH